MYQFILKCNPLQPQRSYSLIPSGLEPRKHALKQRTGSVLILVCFSMAILIGVVGLVLDSGMMTSKRRELQNATDCAATAAATTLYRGGTASDALQVVEAYLSENNFDTASVSVNTPPTSGLHVGNNNYVEVIASLPYSTHLMHLVGNEREHTIVSRSVAGFERSTSDAALVILDPDPPSLQISGVTGIAPSFPALLGGLEVLGLGEVRTNASILVNTEWGGVDEDGNAVGEQDLLRHAVSCTPLLNLTHLTAKDIRVVGGVDSPSNYGNYTGNQTSPLRANRLPVPDPYLDLPVPTISSDPANVNSTLRGSVSVSLPNLPFLNPTVLQPGVYEWISVIGGSVKFQPGVYIIRNVNPVTGISLALVAGKIDARGVMFYVTNSNGYLAGGGTPDNSDGEAEPQFTLLGSVPPSVVLNAALFTSQFSPLLDAGSPFNGMLVYQRRQDYRPILILHQDLLGLGLGTGSISGNIYAKWGHVIFAGNSTYDVSVVSGTLRLLSITGMTFNPSVPLPPAHDVYLVE